MTAQQSANRIWEPPSESPALTLLLPDGWENVETQDDILFLIARRLRELILAEDDPKESVAYLLSELENAGLIDPYLDRKALIKGSASEVASLLERPDLRSRLLEMSGVEKSDFPLKPNGTPDGLETYQSLSLTDWVNDVLPPPLL